jgi:SfnB family sulfur acquisition oxidoreductase
MSNNLDSLWYTSSRIPNAFGLAVQLGELQKDLRSRGIQLKESTATHKSDISFDQNITSFYYANGVDRKTIGLSSLEQREFILVRKGSSITTLQQLKGARLGIPIDFNNLTNEAKAISLHGFHSALRAANLSNLDVQWTNLPLFKKSDEFASKVHSQRAFFQREAQALMNEEVDAIYVYGSAGLDIQLFLDAHILIDLAHIPSENNHVHHGVPLSFTVSAELLQQHSDIVNRIVAHTLVAADWALKHWEEVNRIVAKEVGIPEELVEAAYSERLYTQFTFDLAPEKLAVISDLQTFLLNNELLRSVFLLEDRIDSMRIPAARALISSGGIPYPLSASVSKYSLQDVPADYFRKSAPVHIIKSDEEAIQAAKTFAAEIKGGASDRDRYRKLPFDEIKKLSEMGLLGLVVPKAYGGPEVSTNTLMEVFKIISAADGAIGQIPQNHHFFVKVVELNGTEEQKAFFFAQVLQGAQFGNGLAERGNKSFADMLTRLTSDGNGKFRLSGKKYYCTGALFSSWIPIIALDDSGNRVAVFVPRDAKGLTIIDDWSGIGQRTTASGSVILDDIEVTEAHVFPHYKIFEGPQYFNAFGQIMHAAIDIGIAIAAMDDAAKFVREKSRPSFQSGLKTAAEEPYLIRRFGELGVGLLSAEALLEKAANSIDKSRSLLNEDTAGTATLQVDAVKYLATDVVIEITNALFEVAGTSSMDEKYNLDRHWRNGRIHTLHDPARWKLHHVGNWYLNELYPPNPFAQSFKNRG